MKYSTIEELTRSATARRLRIDNTPPASAVTALKELVDKVLDPLREAWGGPIRVNSGYRCPLLNKASISEARRPTSPSAHAAATAACWRSSSA